MKIKYEVCTVEPEGRNYNLYKTVKNTVKGVASTKEESYGFGLRFETVIETIIKDKLSEGNEVFTLREYVDEYKKVKDDILKILS